MWHFRGTNRIWGFFFKAGSIITLRAPIVQSFMSRWTHATVWKLDGFPGVELVAKLKPKCLILIVVQVGSDQCQNSVSLHMLGQHIS